MAYQLEQALILIPILLLIYGLYSIWTNYKQVKKDCLFAEEYRQKMNQFEVFCKKEKYGFQSKNIEEYEKTATWLVRNEIEIQKLVGNSGFVIIDKKKYPLISNCIPKIMNYYNGTYGTDLLYVDDYYNYNNIKEHFFNCEYTLNRYIGHMEERLQLLNQKRKNPFEWIKLGTEKAINKILKSLNILDKMSMHTKNLLTNIIIVAQLIIVLINTYLILL